MHAVFGTIKWKGIELCLVEVTCGCVRSLCKWVGDEVLKAVGVMEKFTLFSVETNIYCLCKKLLIHYGGPLCYICN